MQIVELRVNVEKSQLAQLEAQVNKLDGKKIDLKVNVQGLQGINKEMTNFVNAMARYQGASAKIASANAKQRDSESKLAIAQEKTAQTANRKAEAHSKLLTQMQRTQQEERKLQTQIHKTNQERQKSVTQAGRVRAEEVKLQQQMERTRRVQEQNAKGAQAYGQAMEKAGKQVSGFHQLMGGSLGEIAGRMFMWQAMGEAVSIPIRAMKEAIDTMKAVDDEMVEIRKVTDFNKQQLKDLEEQAYRTASAYGETADSYLQNVAAFARAGYQDQSSAMAELSTKTQIVADTTADIANQFLLSTDAAYQYNGSIEALTRVLDGANEIENNNATSIEKIAEGMGLVAPVAAQARMGVDELVAAIGTITAVTQRSGAESARAMRALILNILGDTQTEVEEGVTLTAEQINNMKDVLKQYAPEALKAAEATGEVIDPMIAIQGLAKAFQDGVIDEQKLMEIVTDIGGKLRSSQLLALVQNWDMYEKMLEEYRNAAGSADKEVQNAMDSWSRKVNVLKNTWTEFVSNMVETDTIKGALDGITSAIEFLDTDIGRTTMKIAGFAAGALLLGSAIKGIGTAIAGTKLANFVSALTQAALGSKAAASSLVFMGKNLVTFLFNPVTASAAAIIGMIAAMDAATVSFKEQSKAVEELEEQYETMYGAGSEYAQLMEGHNAGTLNQQEERRLALLTAEANELERQLKAAQELEYSLFQREQGSDTNRHISRRDREGNPIWETNEDEITKDVKATKELKSAQDDLAKAFTDGESNIQGYRDGILDLIADNKDLYETLSRFDELGKDLPDAQREFLDFYNWLLDTVNMSDEDLKLEIGLEGFDKIAEVAGRSVIDVNALRERLQELGLTTEEINSAIAELESRGAVTIDIENDGADELLSDLEEIGIAVRDLETGEIKINIEDLEALGTALGLSQDQIALFLQKMREVDGVTFTNAKGEIIGVDNALLALSQKSPLELAMSVNDQASPKIDEATDKAENFNAQSPNPTLQATDNASGTILSASATARMFGDMRPNPTLTATDNATSVINRAVSALKGFVSKTITLTTKYVTSGTGPGGGTWGSGKAGPGPKAAGDVNFQGGRVLLGDELSSDGSPRPELVIRRSGDAFLAGINGPVVTTLPAGARIFTYRETMDIFSGKDIVPVDGFALGGSTKVKKGSASSVGSGINRTSLSGAVSRAKSGTSYKGGSSSSSGGSSGGGSSSGTSKAASSSGSSSKSGTSSGTSSKSGSRGRTSSSSGSGSSSGSDTDEYLESLKKQLEVLQAQYSFLEASDAETGELIAKSQEIQGQLHTINDYLRATGGEEKEILDNSASWYKELEKIRESQRSAFQKERALLESEVELYEKQGQEADAIVGKLKAIQDTLQKEADYLRSIKAEQAEINELSIEWWEIQEKIQATQRAIFQDERALLNTEVELYERQGKSVAERISKLREVQTNLKKEIQYLETIKASQTEINELTLEWWDVQDKILQIRQDLINELNNAVSKEIQKAQEQRDAELAAIDAQIQRLKEERDIQKEQLELEEKRKKIEEARFALENAQHERTVRYYNKQTNQWEWGPDQASLKSAQKSYEDAQKDLEEYLAEKAFEAQIKALEDQKEEINGRYDQIESGWKNLLEQFEEPVRDIVDILNDLKEAELMAVEKVDEIGNYVGDIKEYTGQINQSITGTRTSTVARSADGSEYQIGSQRGIDFLNSAAAGTTMTGGDGSSWTKNANGTTTITKNGKTYTTSGASSYEIGSEKGINFVNSAASGETMTGGDGSQWRKNADGSTTITKNGTTYTVNGTGGTFSGISAGSSGGSRTGYSSSGAAYNIGSQKGLDFINNSAAGATMIGGDGSTWTKLANGSTTITKNGVTYTVYDSGGVLSGIGGIKRSGGDEMVIPPDITNFMLRPAADQRFRARMAELSYLYGNRPLPGTSSKNRTSQDHYGDVYTFGDVTLSEDKAKSTTVYELAQMSRSLGLHRNN